MSNSHLLSSLSPSANDTGTAQPASQTSDSSTNLLDFPSDATFRIWRKPTDGVEPIDGGIFHIGELINGDGDHILVCMASMASDDWKAIRLALTIGDQLELNPLLVASLDRTQIGSGLWTAMHLAGLHGLTKQPTHPTVFSPSRTLMHLLGIGASGLERTRNALVLIRNGHVVTKWVSAEMDGNEGHDWSLILSMIE